MGGGGGGAGELGVSSPLIWGDPNCCLSDLTGGLGLYNLPHPLSVPFSYCNKLGLASC